MYGSVLPSYKSKKEETGEKQEEIKVDDPRNRDRVRQIIDEYD